MQPVTASKPEEDEFLAALAQNQGLALQNQRAKLVLDYLRQADRKSATEGGFDESAESSAPVYPELNESAASALSEALKRSIQIEVANHLRRYSPRVVRAIEAFVLGKQK